MTMPPNPLTVDQKRSLSQASRLAITNSFQSLFSNFSYNEWLHNNAYSVNTTKTLESHFKAGTINHSDLCKYIAASVPNHCMDGWSFLGRALHCVTKGDSNTARHLAYYAELRAAMSLLASVGIGVLDKIHVVIDDNERALKIGNVTTHTFTWLALENWSSTPQAADLLGSITQIDNKPIKEWLIAFLASGNMASVAFNWCSSWGLDLRVFLNDKDARNIVSYRPSHIIASDNTTALECSTFLSELWSIFNPYQTTRFNILDKYLLRKSLKKIDHDTPLLGSQGQISYNDRVATMLSRFSFNDPISDLWKVFFLGENYPDPLLLHEAEKQQNYLHPRHHFEVLSRAALLLRMATGSCFQLINSSTFSSSDLEFWWNNLGYERGLWNQRNKPGTNPNDIMSLWDEVDIALQKMAVWNNNVAHPSFFGLIKKQNSSLRILESCERIGLWGLIP